MGKNAVEDEVMNKDETQAHQQNPLTPSNQVDGWLKCKKRSRRSTKRKVLDSSLRCNVERGTKTKNRYQYRSNLQSVVREISKIKFKKQHLEKLKEHCPFWNLCELIISKDITKQACRKSDTDTKSLIKNFDRSKRAFYLGGKYLEITQQDMQQIFGISGGREKISLGNVNFQNYSLFKRRFVGLGILTQAHISAVLEVASTGTSEEDFEDFPKLMTLFLLAVLFVPCKGVTLGWGYIEYVDDLEKIKKLDWAGHVFEKLHSSLCQNDNPEMVTGCVMALLYWVMNNFNISDPTNKEAQLLCQKWDLRDMAKATKMTIKDICLSKNQGEGSFRSKKRLARAVNRKTSGMGLGCDMQRAVSLTSEEAQSCKKTKKSVDKSSDRLKACSPQAVEKEAYLVRENDWAAKDKAPSPTIPKTNGCSKENETEKQQTSENVEVNNSNFRIIIRGIDITSEIPERMLTSYISLCHTQNKLLHGDVFCA